ncbi:MAG: FHA domain-containing protein [Firmicutes bacterium]|nr:FHA domain-containing protein [Bacillota bacterium]
MENYFGILRFAFLVLLSFFLLLVLKVLNRSMDTSAKDEEESLSLILEVIQGGDYLRNPSVNKFEIENSAVIGRNDECGIQVDDPFASGEHTLLYRKKGKYFIKDCGSKNGTNLNGKIISNETRIKNGDEINLGNIIFRVCL